MKLIDAIVGQATDRPGAAALVWHGDEVTYGELHELACRERDRLDGLGLADGEVVGVLASKSPEAVALVLGCFLAGRPLLLPSPQLGDQTLDLLFAQAGCRHVLAPDPSFSPPKLGSGPQLRGRERSEGDTAIMLTTSGSTGLPKIVPLGWGALDRFAAWAGPQLGLGPGRTVLNYAPLNFDLCLLDVWSTLAHGGRVVLVDPDLATQGGHLLGLIADHDVNVVQAVPMLYRLLLDAPDAAGDGGPALDTVEHVLFTGDAMPEKTLGELPGLFPKARLANVYGCTETNDSFVHELDLDCIEHPVPIGRPLPGVDALIVGDGGEVVTGPGTGELYVQTPFQAAGYLDPARDAGKFVRHPLGHDDRRWFRTGDLVRRRDDGVVLLEGRSDFQVKVRGVAVNTAEVERVLLDHPDVVEAAVVAVPDPLAGRLLAALVRRAPLTRLNSLTLRQHCARRLPQAAIPSSLRIVDDPLPATSTGKVDRRAVERAEADRKTTDRQTTDRKTKEG
jgi:acyl-coenzyme A synthetase/AMP-(fatty) acid ligase